VPRAAAPPPAAAAPPEAPAEAAPLPSPPDAAPPEGASPPSPPAAAPHEGAPAPSPAGVAPAKGAAAPPAGRDDAARVGRPTRVRGRARAEPSSPVPGEAARRRPWVVPLVAAGIVLVVAAGASAAFLLPEDDSPAPPQPTATATASAATTPGPTKPLEAGSLSVDVPEDWTTTAGAALPGFELADAAAAQQDGSVVVGMAPADGATPSLLPVALARSAPKPTSEQLGESLRAYRCDDITLEDGQPADVYVVPTADGIATVACRPPAPASPGFDAACANAARSLAIRDTKVFAAGPSRDYARAVTQAIGNIDAAQGTAMSAMRQAPNGAGQAAAIDDLQAAIDDAANALDRLELSPADRAPNESLLAALASLSARYGSLATAAASGRQDRYGNAITALERAQGRMTTALRILQDVGYEGLPALDAVQPPELKP
jgi:hypothetical protein